MTDSDRLRFIVILVENETILQAYLSHTNGKDKDGVDYQNSEEREPTWQELMCEVFNNEQMDISTPSVPNLHDKFTDSIECPKGKFTLTPDKLSTLLQGRTKKFVGITSVVMGLIWLSLTKILMQRRKYTSVKRTMAILT